ncbi:unnamed protein product [Tilletia controversa]|nr:unnamed protein product [Tilletia controversa]
MPKWKLELVRTQRSRSSTDEEYRPLEENVASASSPPSEAQNAQDVRSEDGNAEDTVPRDVTTVLSVYLTSLALEYLPSDALIPATIMLGLQPARTTLSRLQSRSGAWLWQSHHSFVFRREHEFFECHTLPTLSELLEGHEEVRAQDAVKLTVQIGCGPGIVGPETEVGSTHGEVAGFTAFGGDGRRSGRGADAQGQQGLMLAPFPRLAPFQVPAAHYVSQTILDALEGLVDCARTGDVRIIVRERGLLVRPSVAPPPPPPRRTGSGAMMEGSGSDDGEGGFGPWDEDEVEARSVAYVLPFPVGSFFPLDLQAEAEQQQQQQQQQLEDSGILPPGDPQQQQQQQQQGPTSSATVVVRDRIIWAHSSVLRARSQYFADMIDGGFAEAQDELDDLNSGNGADASCRALKTFRIPDSEWATVYWLIRYLYLEEIEFAEREDVRSAALDNEWMICAEGLHPDPAEQGSVWNAEEEEEEQRAFAAGGEQEDGRSRAAGGRGSNRPMPNWEWRTISELLGEEVGGGGGGVHDSGPGAGLRGHHADDGRADSNATSVDRAFTSEASAPAAAAAAVASSSRPTVPSSPTSSWRGHPGTVYSSSHPPPKMTDEAQAQAQVQVQGASSTSSSSSSSSGGSALSSSRSEHQQQQQEQRHRLSSGSGSGSVSSLRVLETFADGRGNADVGQAARAPPASALATYKLAHRYGQHGLAELAKAHIVETLSPQSAFPVLLATAVYSGLHEAIKRYVYEHWEEVSHTEEFERCCDEVGAGEWGTEAGRSLRIFMQSLLSPARILLASPQR